MTASLPDPVEHDVDAALAAVRAGGELPYYDAQADAKERSRYYSGVGVALDPPGLYRALSALIVETHATRPPYKPMVRLYPWVDLRPDRMLHSVYSGQSFDPAELIRADARIERERTERLRALVTRETALGPREFEAAFDALESELPYNCEHVVPQSWFAKHEPMRGDLHHLFACEPRCNSFRGNSPYFDFADDSATRADCGRAEPAGFEPAGGKGAVARATLYFLLRYPGLVGDEARELQPDGIPILLDWQGRYPVEDYERHRNAAVAQAQGNRNPLIDHPEWAERIAFETSFS
jgi:endonuclease G, mitochondrial